MKLFAEREMAMESAYVHAHTLSFRLLSHRTSLFARRIADELGYYADEADNYVNGLVEYYAETDCDESLVDRVLCDLYDLGIMEERSVIVRKLREAELVSDDDHLYL